MFRQAGRRVKTAPRLAANAAARKKNAMNKSTRENRVITVLGCTASGKSNLGRRLAQALSGEIVSIDSMKVYRGMDIGTAKPGAEERAAIPHHLIDVVDPWESFSVARFVELADAAIADIHARGKPAIAVGGTMLYFKAFYEGLFEAPSADEDFRRRLRARAAQEGLDVLHAELAAVDPVAAERIHRNDLKRIERALEVYTITGRPISALQREWAEPRQRRPDWRWILLGPRREKARASQRINDRVRRMVQGGLVDEARRLWADPRGISEPARQAVGYQELFEHFAGNCPLDYAIEQIKIHSRHLAKHQRTWIRKRTDVHWIEVEKGENNYSVCKRTLHLLAQQGMLHAHERPILDALQ
jgi:tRNA dimethylallyltransferase